MSDLIPFDYSGHEFRGFDRGGIPWFVLADVLAILGLNRSSAALLDDDEKGVHTVDTPGGPQQVVIVSEPGLYSLILRSRKPEAKAFKRWITHEVLPSLRTSGGYSVKQISRRELAQMVIDAEDRAALAEQQVKVLEPAAKFAEDLTSRDGNWSFDSAAKLLSNDPAIRIGQRLLFQTLNDWKWIYRSEGRWCAYQAQINNGRLAHKVYDPRYDEDTGRMMDRQPQVRITWKGMREIHRRLGGERPLRLDFNEAA